MAAATVSLLLALFISFAISRLEGVARSVPLIQWFILIAAMVGMRVAVRVWHERAKRAAVVNAHASVQRVLVVGSGPLAELYFRSVAEYGSHTVHGVVVDRITVTQPFHELSHRAAQALIAVEQGSEVKVEWIVERLGLTHEEDRKSAPPKSECDPLVGRRGDAKFLSLGKYGLLKRALDIVAVVLVIVLLAPLILLIALLVCVNLGFPFVFWQQRPGRLGRPFKLYKFCTMGAAHDAQGNRIPDEHRVSRIGRFLRRTKFDELPQLYNILIGEMSVVGPRPLLPTDQPENNTLRLSVRPGLTGFAQVHGGREISAKDKNALDVWYINNASLWLDFVIIMRTFVVLVRGERVNYHALRAAREGFERQIGEGNIPPCAPSLTPESLVGGRDIWVAPTNN
jgi:lipopolysaccharide/colanic/teichoic acid biosynthesis glycosyltransferase